MMAVRAKRSVRSGGAVRVIPPDQLLGAYCAGFFPMADPEQGTIGWFSPDPRGVMELDAFKISRSLRQRIRQGVFDVRINRHFEQVVRACAERNETWISDVILRSYVGLHRLGYAHSVESWREGQLVGGLYGVAIGGAFFGESMFSRERDASKVALAALVERLTLVGFTLLDTQYLTPHLARLGAVEIPRDQYLKRLREAVTLERSFL
jgi:leucyl/phenylalanyl-tRNA--protein transferase